MICWGKQQSLPHTKPYQTGVEHGRSGRVVLAARPAAKRNLARSFLRRKDQGESRLHASRQNFQKYPCTQPLRAHPTSPYRETAPREGTIRWIPALLSLPIQEERRDLRRKKDLIGSSISIIWVAAQPLRDTLELAKFHPRQKIPKYRIANDIRLCYTGTRTG